MFTGMGKCEGRDQPDTKAEDHPPNDQNNSGTDMIQNAMNSETATEGAGAKTAKTSKDMKSTSVNVKSTTSSVKLTSSPGKLTAENLAGNPTSLLAAIGDSEEYVKPIVKDGEIILEVECGQNKAYLYLSKLCQGSKGPCIYFQTSWLTPNEFQFVSGRETAKDWKRSIRHHGKSLKLLLTKGILSVHPTVCDCEGCRHGSSTPTRCRTGEKRKAPSSQDKKTKRPPGPVEHHVNGAFKPVERSKSQDGVKVALPEEVKVTQDQNFPSVSAKKPSEKHCSPLRESKSANVIDNPKPQFERMDETEAPALKKVKVQCPEGLTLAKAEPQKAPQIIIPVAKPEEIPNAPEPKASVATEPVPSVPVVCPKAEVNQEPQVKVCVKPVTSHPVAEPSAVASVESRVPDVSSAELSVHEPLCVTDPVEEPLKVQSQSSPEKEDSSVNVVSDPPKQDCSSSSDIMPDSPCSSVSSAPSSPVPSDTEKCQRTIPMCHNKSPKAHSFKPVETPQRQCEKRASDARVKDHDRAKENAKPKSHVADEAKIKVADEPSPRGGKREAEKASPRSMPDPRTASEVPQLRQPESGDAAFSDYMRLLAAGHGPHMLPQQPATMESLYSIRPPEIPVNPTMLHPLHACSMYSHPGLVQKDPVLYPTTAGSLPTIGAPCFAPMHLLPPRVQYAVPPPPIMDMPRSLQYLPVPGTVPYHCGGMGGLKRTGSELEPALDLSTSKRLRLEYPGHEYRLDSHPVPHGFQPYAYDYQRNFSEELSRKMHAEEAFKATGSLDFKPYTPSWMDHAGKGVLHRCTCAESRPGDIRFWSVEDVCRFIAMLDGCGIYAENFREQRVDGKILPLLTTDHLMKNLGMKLGPALLVAEAVAKKVQEASKYPGCDSCRSLLLSAHA